MAAAAATEQGPEIREHLGLWDDTWHSTVEVLLQNMTLYLLSFNMRVTGLHEYYALRSHFPWQLYFEAGGSGSAFRACSRAATFCHDDCSQHL